MMRTKLEAGKKYSLEIAKETIADNYENKNAEVMNI